MKKGKLIIVEGPDFCGKSTQLDFLKNNEISSKLIFTREPGSYLPKSKEECEKLRSLVLNNKYSLENEAAIFARSRYIHTKEIIELLEQGHNVISDRYIVSSLAYQGYAQSLGAQKVLDINKATLELLDDAGITIECIKFTIEEKEWRERKTKRLKQESADVIEEKDICESILDFFTDENIFYACTHKLNMNVYEVDATGSVYEVYNQLISTIETILEY